MDQSGQNISFQIFFSQSIVPKEVLRALKNNTSENVDLYPAFYSWDLMHLLVRRNDTDMLMGV